MNYLEGIVYGLIQGLAEFLPISSSGHLALLPYFLKIEDPGVLFDLSMHLGTALSILIYFRKKIINLILELVDFVKGKREKYEAINMVLSTLSSFVLILIIKDTALSFGRTPLIIAFNLFLFGLIMWLFDKFMSKSQALLMKDFRPFNAFIIGLSQAFAIFPGVSRSGITLTAARALGLSRKEGTEYSFLLALPIILAGFAYKLPEFYNGDTNFDLMICLCGMIVSFLTGIITIHYFLKFISKMGLFIFFVYRAILGLLIVALFYSH